MRPQTLLQAGLLSFILFVGFGDRVFPSPLKEASYSTRISINQFLQDLFPTPEIRNPNERTQKLIQSLEAENK